MAGHPYFSRIPCRFAAVDGDAFAYRPDRVHPPAGDAAPALRAAALRRSKPLADLGEEYGDLLVDAVPVVDLELRRDPSTGGELPAWLQRPLLKSPAGSVDGFTSGLRSGLVQERGRWYRLKGCGMVYEGFPIVPVLDDNGKQVFGADGRPLRKLRGCAYQHTCTLELHMSARIDELLAPHAMRCANRPVGWYEYRVPEPLPLVLRCCGVFETIGDRRLGDHVLRGLELLLPSITVGRISPPFPPNPFSGEPRPAPTDSGEVEEMDHTYMALLALGAPADADVAALCDLAAAPPPAAGFAFPRADARPAEVDAALQDEWAAACAALNAAGSAAPDALAESALAAALARLYWRFGRECGTVMRAFQAGGMSWGTYPDGTGFHCNAHSNNFVLVVPQEPVAVAGKTDDEVEEELVARRDLGCALLAPLDLDMAYSRETYAAAGTPAEQAASFLNNFELEPVSLLRDLACSPDTTGTKNDHVVPARCQALRWALRDTLAKAYIQALRGEGDPHANLIDRDLGLQRALLSLALLITANVTA